VNAPGCDETKPMRPCIYFSRLTVDEEQAFWPSRIDVLKRVLTETRHDQRIRDIRSAFEAQIQRDPFDLTRKYSSGTDIMTNRLQQMALFLITAHYLEDVLGIRPACISFYSSGVQPAFVYAGCVSIADYFSHVLPLVHENRVLIEEAGRKHCLVECLLAGADDNDVESCIRAAIVEMGYADRVFIKDVRDRSAVLIAGFNDEVVQVRSHVSDAFAAVAAKERRVHRTDGAHIPLYERAAFASLRAWGGLSHPRVPIVGTCGEVLRPGDGKCVISILRDAVGGPMNTFQTLYQARQLSDSIAVVGSELGAKVVRSPHDEHHSHVELAIDMIGDSLAADAP
jgi:hypothetical protein